MPKDREWQAFDALAPIIDAAAGDPIFPALREWQEARRAELEALDQSVAIQDAHGVGSEAAHAFDNDYLAPPTKRSSEAYRAVACTVASTPAGLTAQLAIAVNMEDAAEQARLGDDPQDHILVSAMEGARRLSGELV